jgi:N-succinyldiaminopimelate aminotransferase
MPVPTQIASAAAWNDDAHVVANRALYREKFNRVVPILSEVFEVHRPAGGFYLWLAVGGDDETFAAKLFQTRNVTVVPGSYLARDGGSGNPGAGKVRVSLVASVEECVAAATRMREFTRLR